MRGWFADEYLHRHIDPGKSGALAVIEDEKLVGVIGFDKQKYLDTLKGIGMNPKGHKVMCCIEKVHAMPKQGSVSMFTFGENFGWLKGVLDAIGIPYQEIPPQTWKKEFGLNSEKARSVEVCKQLFPEARLIPEGCRKEQDGLAEAALMALYAQRRL